MQRLRSYLWAGVGLLSTLPASTWPSEQSTFIRGDGQRIEVFVNPPATAAGNCKGIAVFSHGAGGTGESIDYLQSALAKDGYLTVAPSHQESGPAVLKQLRAQSNLRNAVATLITTTSAYQQRYADLQAAIQFAQNWHSGECITSGPLATSRKPLLLIGHSMGAATAMMAAGAYNKVNMPPMDIFDAYIAMSPQGEGGIFADNAWRDINKPVLLLTGTRDTTIDGASALARTEPFDNMPPGCKYMGMIDGATHLNFAGNGFARKTELLATALVMGFIRAVNTGHCAEPAQISGVNIRYR